MTLDAARIRELLDLRPLPVEGGWYRETYRSADAAPAAGGSGPRSLATAIYYLLTPHTFSSLHRLSGDEIYHFHLGDPVEMLLLRPDGSVETPTLGPDLENGMRVQLVVPGGTWQGSRLRDGGRFALLGTTMAPGFDPTDFEAGDRASLLAAWPAAAGRIRLLTRGA